MSDERADVDQREQQPRRVIEQIADPKRQRELLRQARKRHRPLWVRVLLRAAQAVGVFLLVFIPYTVWFVRGKAEPTIDYLPQLNALNDAPGREDDNAWPYYERAMRLYVEPDKTVGDAPWFESWKIAGISLTARERASLEDWLTANSDAWQEVETGSAKGYFHRTFERLPGKPLLMDCMIHPLLRNVKSLTQIGLWRSRFAIEQGRTDEGLDRCLTLIRAGAHMEASASIIEQLVGYAVGARTCGEFRQILKADKLSAVQLARLQAQVVSVYRDGHPPLNVDGERFVLLDGVEHEFTHGGLGGGHHVVGVYTRFAYAALDIPDTPANRRLRLLFLPIDVAASMIHAGRTRTIAKINHLYDRMGEMVKHSPYERKIHGINELSEGIGRLEKFRYGVVYLLLPAERRASEVRFQRKADHEAVVTILAIRRYRLEIAEYPPDLKMLVDAGYLAEVPMDPFSDRPLIYRPAGDGFLLYSVGRDFDDDGGESGRNEHGEPKMWAEEGDTVFWPVTP